jgi:hypothetical protein
VKRNKLKNDAVPEEIFNNEYRLTKTGLGMTLLERVERLESQMETQNYKHCVSTRERTAQRKRLHDYVEEATEDAKDAKVMADYMTRRMNSKMEERMEAIQDYTEKAVQGLQKKTKIMNATVEMCVESCNETLDVIKGEERERTVALDKLIRENKKNKE